MRRSFYYCAYVIFVVLSMTGCLSPAPDCALEETFCVGLVTNLQKVTDKGFNQSAWEGLQQAKSDGLVSWIDYIESTDYRDFKKNIASFANLGYDVIVIVGTTPANDTRAMAAEYPDIYFIGVDQYQDWSSDADSTNDFPNLVGLVFPEDQAGFLAGALAAMMTETGVVGAICASDQSDIIWRYGEGFRAGAIYIDPNIDADVIYHSEVSIEMSFHDPEWGALTAGSIIDGGVDVLFGIGAETGTGALNEASGRGIYVIGAEIDQYLTQPIAAARMLTSVINLIASGLYELLQAGRDDQRGVSAFPAGNYYGKIGIAPFHDLEEIIPDEIKVRLEEINLMLENRVLLPGVPTTAP